MITKYSNRNNFILLREFSHVKMKKEKKINTTTTTIDDEDDDDEKDEEPKREEEQVREKEKVGVILSIVNKFA